MGHLQPKYQGTQSHTALTTIIIKNSIMWPGYPDSTSKSSYHSRESDELPTSPINMTIILAIDYCLFQIHFAKRIGFCHQM
jgi:hypothetical protein